VDEESDVEGSTGREKPIAAFTHPHHLGKMGGENADKRTASLIQGAK